MAPRRTKKGRSPIDPGRRAFLRRSFTGMGLLMAGPTLHACSGGEDADPEPLVIPTTSNIANLGPLGEPDENGVRLPAGFRSRVVARSGDLVGGSDYIWHEAPDGGATFPTDDHGWIYVSNSEHAFAGSGGVGAIRFSRNGDIVDAYRILDDTLRNCAGGTTPWGTWLSCEEHNNGLTHECDPLGVMEARERPVLGVFKHEAVAVDPVNHHLYLTEPEGELLPLLQVAEHPASEITGPALAPDRRRLYFSSQRGASGNLLGEDGVTFEIEGPFFV